MRNATLKCGTLALLAPALAVMPAGAGQLRVNVSTNFFTPAAATVNQGDHITWVWVSGQHTVTSGTPGSPNGIFDSGGEPLGLVGARYTWQAPMSNMSTPYHCVPHGAAMTGTVSVLATGAPVSNFRLAEVYFNDPNGDDFIEIVNLGDAPGDLAGYRISTATGASFTLPGNDHAVPIGGRVVIWLGRSGTNSLTELFFPAESELERTGSAAIYAPNTVNPSLLLPDQIIDFVQWGAASQANSATAATASLWASSEFVDPPAIGHTIEFCGNGTQRGLEYWDKIMFPTPGTTDCVTPASSATWGRIKTLYR